MTRTRSYLLTTTALASIVGAAVPAFAQAPAPAQMYAPAPMYAPPPAPAPMVAPAPMQEPLPVLPAAPVLAPRAADDMTGSVGFGVGIIAGNDLIKPDTDPTTSHPDMGATVYMRYFLSDSMSIVPKLNFSMTKKKDTDATWGFAPEVTALFTLLKGASTRLDAGVGLGFALAKNQTPANAGSDNTYFSIWVPVTLGVEHYFTRWFAMGIWTASPLVQFAKQGDPWGMTLSVNNTTYSGTLTFYTD